MIDRPSPPTDPPPADAADRSAGAEAAWLYLLGGLGAEEADVFESALADDPALQGHLADAVAWTAMLRLAGDETSPLRTVEAAGATVARRDATGDSSRRRWRTLAAGGGLLAAGLALGVVVTGPGRLAGGRANSSIVDVPVASVDHSPEQVALSRIWWTVSQEDAARDDVWHDGLVTGPESPAVSPTAAVPRVESGTEEVDDVPSAGEPLAVAPPAWLVAALTLGPDAVRPPGPSEGDDAGSEGSSPEAPVGPGGPL